MILNAFDGDKDAPAAEVAPLASTVEATEPANTEAEEEAKAEAAEKAEEEAKAEAAEKAEEEAKAEAAEKAEEEAKAHYLGQKVEIGEMVYKVKSVKTAQSVGESFLAEKAKGTYVIVSVEVTNNSDDSVTVDSSYFQLLSGDKTYDADDMASLAANSSDDGANSFYLEDLNPDLTMSGKIVFDVSEKVANAKANRLHIQTGFWGTETDEVKLTKKK